MKNWGYALYRCMPEQGPIEWKRKLNVTMDEAREELIRLRRKYYFVEGTWQSHPCTIEEDPKV